MLGTLNLDSRRLTPSQESDGLTCLQLYRRFRDAVAVGTLRQGDHVPSMEKPLQRTQSLTKYRSTGLRVWAHVEHPDGLRTLGITC